jgi:uncharacterized protein YybS (DUF2232 family)
MVRPLTIIGMVRASVLSGALFLVGGVVPVVGGAAMLWAPAPVLIYAVGRFQASRRALAAVGLAAGLVMAVAGPLPAVAYAATFGLASVVACGMIERHCRFETIVVVAGAAMLLTGTIAAVAFAGSPETLAELIRGALKAGIARGQEFYKFVGLSAEMRKSLQETLLNLTVQLVPALLAISAAATVLFNLGLFWRWTGKQRLSYTLFGELTKWATPEWMVWVLLASGFAYQGFEYLVPIKALEIVALDLLVCAAAVYFCQGLAIISFYFKALAVPTPLRVVIYIIAGAQPVLAVLVCTAGVLDLWVDFRRLKPPHEKAGSFDDYL